jgi:hypothetical protein
MYEASLLENIGVFSTFHVERPSTLLSFSNVKEQSKERKMQRQKKINMMASKTL